MEKARLVLQRNFVLVLALTAMVTGCNTACSSRPCREPRAPELDLTKKPTRATNPPLGAETPLAISAQSPLQNPVGQNEALSDRRQPPRVRVYKPDGSRQCETSKGQAVDIMERELAGIRVYSREKRKDGLMHIQVCGSPTGMVNLFEIDFGNLKQAEERGFRRFED